MSILKEIGDYYLFFLKTSEEEKKIVLFVENEGYYPYFEGLINELVIKNKQKICYITSDSKDPILKKSESGINVFYINKLMPFFMLFLKCRIFVMTLTDLNQLHFKRSMYPVHYVYIFHSMVSTHMMYKYGAFDYYDSILCPGEQHVAEIREHEKLNHLNEKILIEAGYYRLERIYEKYQKYLEEASHDDGKSTILIAPSWGVDNILESCGESIVALLLENGYKVIVRPHPETVKRSLGMINKLDRMFKDNPDFYLERSVSTDDSLLKSEILICDCSGVALEYAFGTERPVLFLGVPYKIRNENYKKLGIEPLELSIRDKIGVIVLPGKLDTVPTVIEQLKADRDEYKERITKLREGNIYAFMHSSEIGAKHILSC